MTAKKDASLLNYNLHRPQVRSKVWLCKNAFHFLVHFSPPHAQIKLELLTLDYIHHYYPNGFLNISTMITSTVIESNVKLYIVTVV